MALNVTGLKKGVKPAATVIEVQPAAGQPIGKAGNSVKVTNVTETPAVFAGIPAIKRTEPALESLTDDDSRYPGPSARQLGVGKIRVDYRPVYPNAAISDAFFDAGKIVKKETKAGKKVSTYQGGKLSLSVAGLPIVVLSGNDLAVILCHLSLNPAVLKDAADLIIPADGAAAINAAGGRNNGGLMADLAEWWKTVNS